MREVLPEQRRTEILKLIRASGSASVAHLSRQLGASVSTIRRDLDHLTDLGFLARSHGGAVVDPIQRSTFEPKGEVGANLASQEKRAIGVAAAELVNPGQCVAFDSGSTVLEVARAVVERGIPLTAVTNDLRIATICSRAPEITLVVLGGTLRPSQYTLLGEPGVSFLSTLHVDIAFLGIHSMFEGRLTETSLEVANMKVSMLDAAAVPILVADSSKFKSHAFKEVAPLRRFRKLVTDEGIAPAHLDMLRKHEIEIDLAPVLHEGAGNGVRR